MNNSFRKIYTIESSLGSSKPLPRQRRENLLDFFQLDETEIASLKPREHEKKKNSCSIKQPTFTAQEERKKEKKKHTSAQLERLHRQMDQRIVLNGSQGQRF